MCYAIGKTQSFKKLIILFLWILCFCQMVVYVGKVNMFYPDRSRFL